MPQGTAPPASAHNITDNLLSEGNSSMNEAKVVTGTPARGSRKGSKKGSRKGTPGRSVKSVRSGKSSQVNTPVPGNKMNMSML